MDYHDIKLLQVKTKTKSSEAMIKMACILEVVEVNYNLLEVNIWSMHSLNSYVAYPQLSSEARKRLRAEPTQGE